MSKTDDLAARVVATLDWAGRLEAVARALVVDWNRSGASPDEGRLLDLRAVLHEKP